MISIGLSSDGDTENGGLFHQGSLSLFFTPRSKFTSSRQSPWISCKFLSRGFIEWWDNNAERDLRDYLVRFLTRKPCHLGGGEEVWAST